MDSHRVVILGSGDAFSAGGRHQAAYMVEGAGGSLLLDCGPGILTALNRNKISAKPIDTIVLSHFHGDHFAGLPFLFLHFIYIEPRTKPLRIVGPPRVEDRVMMLYRAMYADSAAGRHPYPMEFIEAMPGQELMLDGFQVEPFRVPHQEDPPSYGYAIRMDGRKIVYSGDSGWTEALVEQAKGSDLFLCECSFFETRMATHMDYLRILENIDRFGTRRLVLTHVGDEVLERAQEVEVELASDGMIVTV